MIHLMQADGDVLSLSHKPKRIVSLVPSVTESLILMGVMPVGRSSFCIEPSGIVQSIDRMGGTKTPNLKRILAKDPDLVIVNKEENRKEDVDALMGEGVSTWVTYPNNVLEAFQMLKEMAQLTHDPDKARAMLDPLETFVTTDFPFVDQKVLVMIWKDPWMVAGTQTYTDGLISFSGGVNVCDQPRYPEMTQDQLQSLNPDVVLLPTEPYHFELEDQKAFEALFPNACVRLFSGEDLFWSGHRAMQATKDMVEIFKEST